MIINRNCSLKKFTQPADLKSVTNPSPRQWWLYDSVSGKRIDGENHQSTVKLLAELPRERWEQWYVWSPGMPAWVLVSNCPELWESLTRYFQVDRRKLSVVPPAPPEKIWRSPPSQPEKWEDRRRAKRYGLRLQVVIVAGKSTFKTFSRDISVGGILLEKKLPWSEKACSVYISDPQTHEKIEFHSWIVGDVQNPFRIAFVATNDQFEAKLKTWLSQLQKEKAA